MKDDRGHGGVRRMEVAEDEGRRALVVDGVILSVAVEGNDPPSGYWGAMLPEGTPRSALLLGLGGGTLSHLLDRRYPGIQMVGVDFDEELIAFAKENFDLEMANLEIVVGDAFAYVEACDLHFDYVAVDLFAGYDFQRGSLAKPFLRKLRAMVGQRGEVVFNLFKDRRTDLHLERIGRILRIVRVERAGGNVIARCRG